MSNLPSPEAFVIDLPLSVIVDEADLHKRGMPYCITLLNATGIGRFLPLFTDDDLAARLAEQAQLPGRTVVHLESFKAVRQIVTEFGKAGGQYIGIDVALGAHPRGRFGTVQEFIDMLPPDAPEPA